MKTLGNLINKTYSVISLIFVYGLVLNISFLLNIRISFQTIYRNTINI